MDLVIDKHLELSDVVNVVRNNGTIRLAQDAIDRVEKCREFLDTFFMDKDCAVYGINTGFGALHNVVIEQENLSQLQENLVRSHACGMGEKIKVKIVRCMLVLKAQGLAFGHSGVQLATVQLICDMFNKGITPVVYSKGSLGASGDLAPLAHIALPLLGEGKVNYKGKEVATMIAFKEEGLEPISLRSKEGLALLNGTQFMGAHSLYMVEKCERLFHWADIIASLSIDALDGHLDPFHEAIQRMRPHVGQINTAARIREVLEGSNYISRDKIHVQDPYCMRCIPQVHGASRDALAHIRKVTDVEINSVTDNPTIFPDSKTIISAGNFHGQPLALSLDFLAIAMAEMGSISERRTYKLNGGHRGLPSFLVRNSGLNSGFMITQYTAASIVSENKQLCTPASVDTIDSSQGQEDHVSMGANAATKAKRVYDNLEMVLAIELFNAAQAMELRGVENTSPILKRVMSRFREYVPFIENDEELSTHMNNSLGFLQEFLPTDFHS
ncbi:MAG: histidine ammonia-lyase [Flavobacteriales bacterium]|nr:histidine ammonia-lyase [Flavobacteriales bacterium]NNK80139.1 histidine ammonia-lyase [Flavobacteriales bacterium]